MFTLKLPSLSNQDDAKMEFVQEAFLMRRSLILPEVSHFPEAAGSITALLPVLVLCLALLVLVLPSKKRLCRCCMCLAAELEIKS